MSVRWNIELLDGTELADGALEGGRTYLESWCRFGRGLGLLLIPSYLDAPGLMSRRSGTSLDELRSEVETLRAAWGSDPAIADRPPDPNDLGGQQLLVHLQVRSQDLLDAIDLAGRHSGTVAWLMVTPPGWSTPVQPSPPDPRRHS